MNSAESPVYFVTLRPLFAELGFIHAGVAALSAPTSLPFYQDWLESGYAGDMQYLHDHLEQKRDPAQLLPSAHSVISVMAPYFPHPQPRELPGENLRVALYAQGEDYHFWFKERLQKICQSLEEKFPGEKFKAFVDSGPVLERDYAQKAGLGWIGKNSCLINQQDGSLHFLGEIFTTLKVEADSGFAADRCGTCTRCLDICPTGALVAERTLDATKCISYLTIETKSLPPEDLREKMGDWFFGCDLCQTVCPWNQRLWKERLESVPRRDLHEPENAGARRRELIEDLRWILTGSNKQLEKRFYGSALLRARPRGLKRNAIIVAANQGLYELREELKDLLKDSYLAPLTQWALERL